MKIPVRLPEGRVTSSDDVPPEIRDFVQCILDTEFPKFNEGGEVRFERAETENPDEQGPFEKVCLVLSRQCSTSIDLTEYTGKGGADKFRSAVVRLFVRYWRREMEKRARELADFHSRVLHFTSSIFA